MKPRHDSQFKSLDLIRPIDSEDGAGLVRFFENNNTPDVTRHFSPFPLTSETAQRIARTPGRDRYFVGLVRGEIVALAMLRGWDEGFDIPSFGICVDRAHQGVGIGRAMTEYSIEAARASGCGAVRLSVYATNRRAIRLYESLGFRETERTAIRVQGSSDLKVVMRKEL